MANQREKKEKKEKGKKKNRANEKGGAAQKSRKGGTVANQKAQEAPKPRPSLNQGLVFYLLKKLLRKISNG